MWLVPFLAARVGLLAAEPVDLVNYGVGGIILAAFVSGFIVAKPTVDREATRADRAEDRLDQVIKDVMERVAPVLERSIAVQETAMATMDERARVDREVVSVLEDVRRLLEQRR